MRKHKFTLKVGNAVVFNGEGLSYQTFREAQKALDRAMYQDCGQSMFDKTVAVGANGSATINLAWVCTMNGRAPARPKDVIQAEKDRRAAEREKEEAEKRAREERQEKERLQREANARNRIRQQIDHVFAIGKGAADSDPSKYITCQSCDAPASVLRLSQPLARGSHVLDEDTITGALCAQHAQITRYNNGYVYAGGFDPKEERIPCDRLEFFYDGVRQIAIKP
jgi:hypothetical protein